MVEFWEPNVEKLPQKELLELQERRLRYIVRYAYEHSRFYRERFDKAGIEPEDIKKLDDVVKLPFTRKSDLRDTYPYGLLCVPLNRIIRFHASSGTTGKPTVVAYTQSDIAEWTASMARALTSIGLGRGDIVQISYGYGLFTGGLGLHYGVEAIGASALPTSVGNTERQVELLVDLGTTAIACTPSYFLHINEVAERMGVKINKTKLKAGVFGAEPWSEETRRRIENTTGIKAYDIFGTSELSGPLFTECQYQNGIHIWGDQFLIEVIDPETGEQLSCGERGELVATTLVKEAMPLIRFRIGDITKLNTEKCNCGRTHPRIMRILGRADNMIVVRGINVFPSQVEAVLMQIPEVGEHFQIIVERKGALDEMMVQVEVTPQAFSDKVEDILKLKQKVEHRLKNVLNLDTKVELVEYGTLPRSMGKAQRVIDRRKI
ncbi:MAG: phenylacetate--CoA ligase [Methanocellales archaeon]